METIRWKLILLLSLSIAGCVPLDLSSSGGPYSGTTGSSYDPYGNTYGSNDYYRQREEERIRDERRDLERERDRLDDERDRLERQREKQREREAQARAAPPPPPREQCPSGFRPSSDKCTSSERKHGCKDIRTDSGLLCVSR